MGKFGSQESNRKFKKTIICRFVTFVENESDSANNATYSKGASAKVASKAKGSERYPSRLMNQKVSSVATQS